jgi:hypothetical protein
MKRHLRSALSEIMCPAEARQRIGEAQRRRRAAEKTPEVTVLEPISLELLPLQQPR